MMEQVMEAKEVAGVDVTGLEDWQVRLLMEREELDVRLTKLNDALRRPTFMVISYPQRQLLTAQSRAMERYLYLLDKRIAYFLPEFEPEELQ